MQGLPGGELTTSKSAFELVAEGQRELCLCAGDAHLFEDILTASLGCSGGPEVVVEGNKGQEVAATNEVRSRSLYSVVTPT